MRKPLASAKNVFLNMNSSKLIHTIKEGQEARNSTLTMGNGKHYWKTMVMVGSIFSSLLLVHRHMAWGTSW